MRIVFLSFVLALTLGTALAASHSAYACDPSPCSKSGDSK